MADINSNPRQMQRYEVRKDDEELVLKFRVYDHEQQDVLREGLMPIGFSTAKDAQEYIDLYLPTADINIISRAKVEEFREWHLANGGDGGIIYDLLARLDEAERLLMLALPQLQPDASLLPGEISRFLGDG